MGRVEVMSRVPAALQVLRRTEAGNIVSSPFLHTNTPLSSLPPSVPPSPLLIPSPLSPHLETPPMSPSRLPVSSPCLPPHLHTLLVPPFPSLYCPHA
ncbi:hypothetical protein E2C01_048075 [Portunus trituberculatus]|uniref:Uncharacterized protein n=1 Tax=Portunus trituberculatus TaxID=210409 RepID=A0A5B7G9M0_PORTR|nr:hypothetical protein [Portunus trituberculatus]